MKKYAPTNCMALASEIKSVSDAMSKDSHSIGKIQREQSKNFTEGLLLYWLIYLNQILNLKNPMSDAQIKLAASLICEEFYMLKMADITLIFKRAISGKYGEFYERLSIDKVLTFFRTYLEERFEVVLSDREREHREFKYNDKI